MEIELMGWIGEDNDEEVILTLMNLSKKNFVLNFSDTREG